MERPPLPRLDAASQLSGGVEEAAPTFGTATDDQRGHLRARTVRLRQARYVDGCGNAGSPTGREPYGDGAAVVVRGRESRPPSGAP